MGFYFVIVLLAMFVHGVHSYHLHRKTEESGSAAIDAIADSVVWAFVVYTLSIATLIALVILASYFHWFQ